LTFDFREIVTQYGLVHKNMVDALNTERSLCKKVESKINEIVHIIELKDLSASEMSKFYKHLKDLYRSRRQHKEHIIVFQNIIEHQKNPMEEMKESEARFDRYKKETELSYKKFQQGQKEPS